jgi:hypothetical protein
MLQPSESKGLQKTFTNGAKSPRYNGANRRATGILPEPSGEHGYEMRLDKYTDYKQLLAAIKAHQQTCCIKFSSEKQKSRGAILIFQGRVLGVIYGRKDLVGKLFHEEAYPLAIKDLLDGETEVTAHVLSEALAVATASLFHGQFGVTGEQKVGQNAFSECYANLTESKMPGCILVRDNEELTVFAAYIFGGKMVALYSGMEGWLPATLQVAFQKMAQKDEVKVTSAVLKVGDINEVTGLTFTLSEIGSQTEQRRAEARKQSDQASLMHRRGHTDLTKKDSVRTGFVGRKTNGMTVDLELLLRQRLAHLAMG